MVAQETRFVLGYRVLPSFVGPRDGCVWFTRFFFGCRLPRRRSLIEAIEKYRWRSGFFSNRPRPQLPRRWRGKQPKKKKRKEKMRHTHTHTHTQERETRKRTGGEGKRQKIKIKINKERERGPRWRGQRVDKVRFTSTDRWSGGVSRDLVTRYGTVRKVPTVEKKKKKEKQQHQLFTKEK